MSTFTQEQKEQLVCNPLFHTKYQFTIWRSFLIEEMRFLLEKFLIFSNILGYFIFLISNSSIAYSESITEDNLEIAASNQNQTEYLFSDYDDYEAVLSKKLSDTEFKSRPLIGDTTLHNFLRVDTSYEYEVTGSDEALTVLIVIKTTRDYDGDGVIDNVKTVYEKNIGGRRESKTEFDINGDGIADNIVWIHQEKGSKDSVTKIDIGADGIINEVVTKTYDSSTDLWTRSFDGNADGIADKIRKFKRTSISGDSI